jgi:hypothetical protein
LSAITAIPLPPDAPSLHPGDHIRITQRIVGREGNWAAPVEGTVQSYTPEPTGSWFAQGRDDKLWLLRVHLRKPDGEVSNLILDAFSRIETLPG